MLCACAGRRIPIHDAARPGWTRSRQSLGSRTADAFKTTTPPLATHTLQNQCKPLRVPKKLHAQVVVSCPEIGGQALCTGCQNTPTLLWQDHTTSLVAVELQGSHEASYYDLALPTAHWPRDIHPETWMHAAISLLLLLLLSLELVSGHSFRRAEKTVLNAYMVRVVGLRQRSLTMANSVREWLHPGSPN